MRSMIVTFGLVTAATLGCNAEEGSPEGQGFEDHNTGGIDVLRDPDGRVLSVRGRFKAPGGDGAEAKAGAFVDLFRESLGLPQGVALGAASVSGTSIQTVSFEVTAGGHPIEGGRLRVRLTPEEVFFVSVNVPATVPEVPEPTLTATEAAARVAEIFPDGEPRDDPRLVIYAPAMWIRGTERPRLAWRVAVQAGKVPSAPVLFVDAIDGTELGRLEQVRRARQRKIYDAKGWFSDANLRDHRELIYDESGVAAGATPWPEATTAWTYAATGCDFLESSFGEDQPCSPLVVYLRYGDPEYAAMDRGDLQFGEGALTDPDEGYRTFMHELGHALVRQRTDDFTYYGESGAVEESIADVFSMLAGLPARWVVDSGHVHERNISDPRAAGNPGTYSGRLTGTADEGEVHENSVMLSHAIWLATIEGLEVGHQDVSGMGHESMTSIIDELLAGYLDGYVTLHQAGASLIDACMVHPMFREVFGRPAAGVSFRDCGLLVNALAEVGLATPDSDLDGWPDDADNCPQRFNPYQRDSDGDRQGDACEPDETSDKLACPIGLTINGLDWQLDPKYFDEQGAPRQPTGIFVNSSGQTDLLCPYTSSDEDVYMIRVNYVFTRPDDPPSVPSCGALDTPYIKIDIQSSTHSIGATWAILHKTTIQKTDPAFAVYEDAVRSFVADGMSRIEPFAATCN